MIFVERYVGVLLDVSWDSGSCCILKVKIPYRQNFYGGV